jgi:UPF0176 protein
VSCPRCFAKGDEEQKKRARERQKQYELAKARRQLHIGAKITINESPSFLREINEH